MYGHLRVIKLEMALSFLLYKHEKCTCIKREYVFFNKDIFDVFGISISSSESK